MRRKDPIKGSRAMRIVPSSPPSPVWDASRALPSLWRDALESWLGAATPPAAAGNGAWRKSATRGVDRAA
ncbi:hypothetical protein [Azospirillum doebereinerae]|uniref:hypothetical protein n=1 Tax=Azospirillum doebereinerae TaxID=92933 RepID=UPI00163C406F|nr:hypothetical protein [Azospirillum doebereinerae]